MRGDTPFGMKGITNEKTQNPKEKGDTIRNEKNDNPFSILTEGL